VTQLALKLNLASALAVALCIGCSTAPPGGTGGNSGGSSGGSTAGSTGGSTGASAFPAGTTTMPLKLAPLAAPRGKSVVYCTNLHLTNTQPIEVIGFVSSQTEGGHHLLLFANKTDQADSQPTPCIQQIDPTVWSLLYASQIPQDVQAFPATTGITIAAHQSVMLQTHYINATSGDLNVTSEVDLEIGPSGSVTVPLAPLLFYNASLQVPPGLSTSTASCPMPADMNLVMVAGHMHRHGIDFTLKAGTGSGQSQIYETHSWDSPTEKFFASPMQVANGSTMTWTCSYANNDGQLIVQPDEMCATLGNFYPAQHGALICFGTSEGTCPQCRFDN
jgi:hypothetical protein